MLNGLGLTIVLAKVTTDQGRAADVFHVRGPGGELDETLSRQVETAMLAALVAADGVAADGVAADGVAHGVAADGQ